MGYHVLCQTPGFECKGVWIRSTMINSTFPFFSYSMLCDSKGCAYKATFHEFISLNNGTRLLYSLLCWSIMGGLNDYIEYHLLSHQHKVCATVPLNLTKIYS